MGSISGLEKIIYKHSNMWSMKRGVNMRFLASTIAVIASIPAVFAQSQMQSPATALWNALKWLFFDIGSNYGSESFIVVVRIIMSLLLFALFYGIMQNKKLNMFEHMSKNVKTMLALTLALLFAVLTPSNLLMTLAVTYSALFFAFTLILIIWIGIMTCFKWLKDEQDSFASYLMRAIASLFFGMVAWWFTGIRESFSSIINQSQLVVGGDVAAIWVLIQWVSFVSSLLFFGAMIWFTLGAMRLRKGELPPPIEGETKVTEVPDKVASKFSAWRASGAAKKVKKLLTDKLNLIVIKKEDFDKKFGVIQSLSTGIMKDSVAFKNSLQDLNAALESLKSELRTSLSASSPNYEDGKKLTAQVQACISLVGDLQNRAARAPQPLDSAFVSNEVKKTVRDLESSIGTMDSSLASLIAKIQ